MDFAGALFAVGHKRFEFRALGLCKVYFPATRWHTPSWWSEYTKILQLSKDLLEKPLSRNPNYIFAHFLLARSYLAEWASQLSQDPRTLEQALAAAQRAIALNDSSPEGHGTLSFVYLWQKQYDQAVAEMERVIALAPNAAGGYARLAEMLSRMGRSEE